MDVLSTALTRRVLTDEHAYLQQTSSRSANVCNSLAVYSCDQEGSKQDVCHLSVEEVHSVVGLGHHGGMVSACGIVLHALQKVLKEM